MYFSKCPCALGETHFQYIPWSAITSSWSRIISEKYPDSFPNLLYKFAHFSQQWDGIPSSTSSLACAGSWVLILAMMMCIGWSLRVLSVCLWLGIVNISLSASWPLEIPLLKILCWPLYPIFKWGIWFIDFWFLEIFILFGYQPSDKWIDGKDVCLFVCFFIL